MTVLYAAAVVASAVFEAQWLMHFEPDDGAPIPVLTVLVTAPAGWLGWALGAPRIPRTGLGGQRRDRTCLDGHGRLRTLAGLDSLEDRHGAEPTTTSNDMSTFNNPE